MTSHISSAKLHKNAVSLLVWDYAILMHISQGRSKRTFYLIPATCLEVGSSDTRSCLGNKVLPASRPLRWQWMEGSDLVLLEFMGRFLLEPWALGAIV